RSHIFRRNLESLRVLSYCIADTSLCKPGSAKVGVSICALGVLLEDLLVLDNCLIRAAFAQKSAREIVLRFFLVRDGCEAPRVSGDGTIEIVFGYKCIRKVA